ncbi:MAG TPA: flagellar hook-associated protein FlgL [Aquabacterium sp.]|uniref:flagellar hook-associated protein FlgL n=1 Tax=Aquabacterium sp. TaxID=1872578 RepID=UPI002E2F5A7B|nr:flagellar hook-associated protein FlgL [Aquabacterium sp.]HEX5372702.1 flagellar hook-associated protein FlgL [Aquabacterium sp.]
MRISTANSFDSAIGNLQRRQQDLSESQMQLTTGKRINVASDDPVAAARAERAMSSIARSEANQRGLEASRNTMGLSEAALGDAVELLQQARETLIAAGNGSYSDGERRSLAIRLREVRNQMLSVANRPDGGGGFVFGGQGSSSPPFVDMPGGVQFVGQGGEAQASSSEKLSLTVDGDLVWLKAKTGNGVFETQVATTNTGEAWISAGSISAPGSLPYPAPTGTTPPVYTIQFATGPGGTTYDILEDGNALASGVPYEKGKSITIPGRGMDVGISGNPANGDSFSIQQSTNTLSVFDTLDRAINALNATNMNNGQVQQTVNTGLAGVDSLLSNIQSARSAVGETLNRMDGIENRISSLKLTAENDRSSAEDLDMVEAISKFQSKQTGYDAALKSYAMVQKLSLFQYVNI